MAKATGSISDTFCNKFYATVTESVVNTLTFKEIMTNVSIFDKAAWIVQRLEWYFDVASVAQLTTAAKLIQVALTATDKTTSLGLDNPSVIDNFQLSVLYQSAVGQQLYSMPFTRDFTNLSGGGLIIAPRPLFIGLKGTGLATAAVCSLRGYFTSLSLTSDNYFELIDFYRIVS